MNQELFNALLPYIVSALATILTAVGAWLGKKVGDYFDSKKHSEVIQDIVEKTVKYVEQVGKSLGSEEKFALAKEKAIQWANTQGLSVSEVELEILIEAFVNSFDKGYQEPVGTE